MRHSASARGRNDARSCGRKGGSALTLPWNQASLPVTQRFSRIGPGWQEGGEARPTIIPRVLHGTVQRIPEICSSKESTIPTESAAAMSGTSMFSIVERPLRRDGTPPRPGHPGHPSSIALRRTFPSPDAQEGSPRRMGRTATLGNSLYRQGRRSPTPKGSARISRDGRDPSAGCRSVERGVREPVEWVASVLPVTPKPRYLSAKDGHCDEVCNAFA